MYILDSTVIIDILRSVAAAEKMNKLVEDAPAATTAFSVFEVFLGLKENEKQAAHDFFSTIPVVDFSQDASFRSVEIERDLTKRGKKTNLVDVFIAGICLADNHTLVTSDKGFRHIKELSVSTVS
ncbi:MAG: type II toxin-antitoxin system VapC family toxin [Candidatus Aenigmarchaeota archaeon]|nr:type II toxin-antitoxin system VapC family toxin [Candidatus Aenigmarchaeota archaeon]